MIMDKELYFRAYQDTNNNRNTSKDNARQKELHISLTYT